MRRWLGAAAFALPALATGCTGVVVQDPPGPRGSYFVGDFSYASGDGAIETMVVGNPFPVQKEAFDQHVRSLMRHQNREVPTEFVSAEDPRTDPLFRVVVAFDLPRAVSEARMCSDPAGLTSEPRADRVNIAIAFCEGDRTKSATFGHARNVAGPEDPKFAELVRYATLFMVPDRDGTQDRGSRTRSWLR